MSDIDLKVKISANDTLSPALQRALDSMEKMATSMAQMSETAKVSSGHTEGLNTGMINLSSALNIVHAAAEIAHKAFEIIAQQLEKAWHEAMEAEKAVARLTGAMVQSGQYTPKAAEELNKYVESLERTVGANGEAARGMIATGLQMGLSIEKSKEMETAARQLAAANGIDVQQAFSALQGAMSGQSRALAKMVPQVKDLTTTNLKLGGAIDVVSKATKAQYAAYQDTLPAALNRAQVGFDNIYKAVGLALTQNAALKGAISAIGTVFFDLADTIERNKDAIKEWVTKGVLLAIDAVGGIAVAFDAVYRTAQIVFNGLKFGMAVVIDAILLPMDALTSAMAKIPGKIGKPFKEASDNIATIRSGMQATMQESSDSIASSLNNETSGYRAVESVILKVREAAVAADASEKQHQKTKEKSLEQTSQHAAALKDLAKSYAGLSIGTDAERMRLKGEVEQRDKDLAEFKAYNDNKNRVAISAAEEQQMELRKVQAGAMKGAGGAGETVATSTVEVDAETKKQAELKVLRDGGRINKDQYDAALLASEQQQQMALFDIDQAGAKARADTLGQSEEGFAAKQANDDAHFQLELQQKLQRAEFEGATDEQISAMKESAEQEHLAQMAGQKEQYVQKEMDQNEKLNKQWEVSLGKVRLEQQKHGQILGTIRGIQQTEEFKGTQQMLSDLSSLRNSHSKKAFEVGKAAATAQAIINTFLGATQAYTALSMIPYVGPILGAIAAAAAIAAGITNVQNIQSQKFNPGGQADSGMDAIPQSLGGKSFVLSAGERVVQPEANRSLTEFLSREKQGAAGGASYSISLYYNGNGDKGDAQKMADLVIDEIRRRSERGTPILSSKGVV